MDLVVAYIAHLAIIEGGDAYEKGAQHGVQPAAIHALAGL